MKFRIEFYDRKPPKAKYDQDGVCYIELNTLEELLQLAIDMDRKVIVYPYQDEPQIEIYDRWRE